MSEEEPTLEEILHFQTLVLLRIYDVLMHHLGQTNPKLAAALEEKHGNNEFGVEV